MYPSPKAGLDGQWWRLGDLCISCYHVLRGIPGILQELEYGDADLVLAHVMTQLSVQAPDMVELLGARIFPIPFVRALPRGVLTWGASCQQDGCDWAALQDLDEVCAAEFLCCWDVYSMREVLFESRQESLILHC